MTEADYPPRHVAIILDGNGRWARQRGLPRLIGHRAGVDNILPAAEAFDHAGVRYLTLYAFSTENWSRPKAEITGLLALLSRRMDREVRACHQLNFRLTHIGRLDRLSGKLRQKIEAAVELTKDNTGLTLCLAFDYGGRGEMIQAAKRIIGSGIASAEIDELVLNQHLHTRYMPDPDLIIRTGGEFRLSNFLLWQAAYSELYFTPVLWPDFNQEEIAKALSDYKRRHRRFGGLQDPNPGAA
jgi:undecaprenyl diphosphate synthase